MTAEQQVVEAVEMQWRSLSADEMRSVKLASLGGEQAARRRQQDAHERTLNYGAEAREALAAKEAAEATVAEMRSVLELGLALKLGAYPAHGSGFVAILIEGDLDEFQRQARALSLKERC